MCACVCVWTVQKYGCSSLLPLTVLILSFSASPLQLNGRHVFEHNTDINYELFILPCDSLKIGSVSYFSYLDFVLWTTEGCFCFSFAQPINRASTYPIYIPCKTEYKTNPVGLSGWNNIIQHTLSMWGPQNKCLSFDYSGFLIYTWGSQGSWTQQQQVSASWMLVGRWEHTFIDNSNYFFRYSLNIITFNLHCSLHGREVS